MRRYEFECPEGATPIDPSGLKISWVKTQADLNRVEAENILKAQGEYLSSSIKPPSTWMNSSYLQRMHKAMFSDVWDWAGTFRQTQTSIGIDPYLIRNNLGCLCKDIVYWCTEPCELTFIEQAIRIHHRLVFIHPFTNGNGRFSRMVADRYLKAWGGEFPAWPEDLSRNGTSRHNYIQALKAADKHDYEPLQEFYVAHGATEPTLSQLLSTTQSTKHFNSEQLSSLVKAHLRQDPTFSSSHSDDIKPLHMAIRRGLKDIAELLVQAGADILAKDNSGKTSFETAIAENQLRIAKLLCDHGYPYYSQGPSPSNLIQYKDRLAKFNLEHLSS